MSIFLNLQSECNKWQSDSTVQPKTYSVRYSCTFAVCLIPLHLSTSCSLCRAYFKADISFSSHGLKKRKKEVLCLTKWAICQHLHLYQLCTSNITQPQVKKLLHDTVNAMKMQQSLAKELQFVRCKQRLSSQEITYVNLQVMKHLSGLRNYNSPTQGEKEGVVVIEPESLQRDKMDKWADK